MKPQPPKVFIPGGSGFNRCGLWICLLQSARKSFLQEQGVSFYIQRNMKGQEIVAAQISYSVIHWVMKCLYICFKKDRGKRGMCLKVVFLN